MAEKEYGGLALDEEGNLIEDEPKPEPKIKYIHGTKFINVYLCDRAYGGPEEGGWWYDTREFIRSTQILPGGKGKRIQADENAWCDEENKFRRSDISSVLSEGRYEVWIEDQPGEHFPMERPHYE